MAQKQLNHHLFDEPYLFEFFQAVRLFEKINPDLKPVGGEALPGEEVVRFRSRISLDFPSSEIHELRDADGAESGRRHVEMLVNFMGMAGVSGVLPVHYTELVMDRVRHRDQALWSFLDIFTHRAVSLFFRAWSKYRFPVGYERGDDRFTRYLFDFCGLGTTGMLGRMAVEDEALLPYAGLIAQRPHSVNAIENMISDHFGVPAKIEQFFGQWLELEKSDLTRLGLSNSGLGVSAIAGSRVWSQESKFRIKLGPMPFRNFQGFLPNGDAYAELGSMVRFMVGLELDFDLQLLLARRQVPGTVLTTRALRRPLLGWTTYLKTGPVARDDDQVVLELKA